jgi:hypothetical protein
MADARPIRNDRISLEPQTETELSELSVNVFFFLGTCIVMPIASVEGGMK